MLAGGDKKRKREFGEEELKSTADSHPKRIRTCNLFKTREKRQTIMGKNFLKDDTWPTWKDILLMEEMNKARKHEDGYFCYNWRDKDLWVEITEAVNEALSRQEKYRIDSVEQSHVPLVVTVEDVTERVRVYKTAYNNKGVDLPSRIDNCNLSSLVRIVFQGMGPPTFPRADTPRRSRNAKLSHGSVLSNVQSGQPGGSSCNG